MNETISAVPHAANRIPDAQILEMGLPLNPLSPEVSGESGNVTELGHTATSNEAILEPVADQEKKEKISAQPIKGWQETEDGRLYLSGNAFLTTLPAEAFITYDETDGNTQPHGGLDAAIFDRLEPGSYSIWSYDKKVHTYTVVEKAGKRFIDYEVQQREEHDPVLLQYWPQVKPAPGDGYRAESKIADEFELAPQYADSQTTRALFKEFGMPESADGKRLLVPTIATLKQLAQERGLGLVVFQSSYLSAEQFTVDGFAEGKIPFASGNVGFYSHDLLSHHTPGELLGGQPLLELLKPLAQKAMAEGREAKVGSALDSATVVLSDVVVNGADKADANALTFELNRSEQMIQRLFIENGLDAPTGAISKILLDGLQRLAAGPDLPESIKQAITEVSSSYEPVDETEDIRFELAHGRRALEAKKLKEILSQAAA